MNTQTNSRLSIFSGYISLPSGNQLALDAQKSFTPNAEFWALWKSDKLTLKRAGIYITREGNQWRGYVRKSDQGFSYSQSDLHRLWVEKAWTFAEGEPVAPVILPVELLTRVTQFPCTRHREYEVVAKRCRNNTFQLRLRCDACDRKTPGAIKWEHFNSGVVIQAIAREIQTERKPKSPSNTHPIFEELRGVDFV